LLLGLLSAGIVVFLLTGSIGTVAYLYRDQGIATNQNEKRDTPVAQVHPQPTSKTVVQQPTNEAESKPAVQVEKPNRRKGDNPPEAAPLAADTSKRKEEARPSKREEEEQPKPTRKEPSKSDVLAKEESVKPEASPKEELSKPEPSAKAETPKPAPPVKEEPSKREEPAKAETPKPAPPVKEEPSKREEPAKVEIPKANPPDTEEASPSNSATSIETPKNGKKSSPLPERRKLTGDVLYRRLVKSCVFVRAKEGWGSGSLIHKQRKLILTNYHVVEGINEVFVSFPRYDNAGEIIVDGKVYERAYRDKELIRGKVLKRVEEKDLALVELDTIPEGIPALKLAPRRASVGQDVHSVGNAGASQARWQYTPGKVKQRSHKNWPAIGGSGRILTFDADILETDSLTNEGDSGGPLVNDALQLVGVTQGASIRARGLSIFIDVSEVKQLLKDFGVDPDEVTATSDGEGGLSETSDILALIKGLEDKEAKVRTEAAGRLAELGPQAKRAAPALLNALKKDEEPLVRQHAALALGRLGPESRDQVRKEVFNALRDKDEDVRLAVLEALANLGKPELTELPILLKHLGTSVENQQHKSCIQIAHSLALLGPSAKVAVPDLRELLKSEDRSVRTAVLLTLQKIGPAAREAAPELSEVLKNNDPYVRMLAALTLTAIDPSLTGAGKDALSVLVKALRPASSAESNSAPAKERIKEISAVLVKVGEPAVERLLRAIEGEFRRNRGQTEAAALDAAAREAALKIIADIGPAAHSNRTIAALAELQRTDPVRSVRAAAQKAFVAIQDSK
jgi:S1-C subfamily serine protease/HEAT repeat protein